MTRQFCTRCGAQGSSDDAFCRSCGAPIAGPTSSPTASPTASRPIDVGDIPATADSQRDSTPSPRRPCPQCGALLLGGQILCSTCTAGQRSEAGLPPYTGGVAGDVPVQEGSDAAWLGALQTENMKWTVVWDAVRSTDWRIRAAVAKNPHLIIEQVKSLQQDANPRVREVVDARSKWLDVDPDDPFKSPVQLGCGCLIIAAIIAGVIWAVMQGAGSQRMYDWNKGDCPPGMYRQIIGTGGEGPGGFLYTCKSN